MQLSNPRYQIEYGSKYDSKLDVAAIAKLIRSDIKAAVKAGALPGCRYSVRLSRYSGGQSIRIGVDGIPFEVLSEERVMAESAEPHTFHGSIPWRSEKAEGLLQTLTAIGNAYNFDGSDTMTDYFHVNFYLSVDLDHDADAERAAIPCSQRERVIP